MTVTIELTPQDTLASTIARYRAAGEDRVLFVIPTGLDFSDVELAALRREAAASGRGIALVSANAGLRAAADRRGISTFLSARRGAQARWRPAGPSVWSWPRRLQATGPAAVEAPPAPGLYARRSPSGFHPIGFMRSFIRQPSPWWATLGLVVALLLMFGGLLYGLATIIPEARIIVVPANESLQVTVPLEAIAGQEAADTDAGTVPARGISVQVTGEARRATSGQRFEPSAKATGQVVLVNRTGRQVTIPTGTVVSTATGNNVSFATTVEAKVEPGSKVTVPIEAQVPGLTGNVRAGTITAVEGPMALYLAASNEAATGGGGSTQVAVVTDDDKVKLQAQLFDELKQKAFEKLNERLAPGTFIPPESVSYLAMSPTFTPFVGDVSPDLYLSMSVQATGLMVDSSTGNEVALDRLQRNMPPGSRLVANSVRYIPGSVSMKDDKTVAFSITAQGTLLRGVDAAAARAAILGMRPANALSTLMARFPLAAEPRISLGPDWLPLIVPTEIPSVPWRIRVIVDWDAAVAAAQGKS